MHSKILSNIDFSIDGKFSGDIRLPYSNNRSPYYHVRIPYFRFKNGSGPKILLLAGNHGDEYEGIFCLTQLCQNIDFRDIKGELTILPLTNQPAVMSGKRLSPFDKGNLNRSFPGSLTDAPTQRLAYYLENELFPKHDIIFDIHSGGTSMHHLSMGLVEFNKNQGHHEKALALMKSMRLPYGFIAYNGEDAPTSMAAAHRAGAIGISGEFGGGASTSIESMSSLRFALDNFFEESGMSEKRFFNTQKNNDTMTLLKIYSHQQSIYSEYRGWFETLVNIGDNVEKGQLAGRYYNLEKLKNPPEELHCPATGVVISRRLHADCQSGDCLIQIGEYA